MIQNLFAWLTEALQSTPLTAISAALMWGVLSILLSPCHLSSIPLIVGFIHGQGITTKKRAFTLASLFSVGILISIALIGYITNLFGRLLGDVGKTGNIIVAFTFFVIGFHLLEIVQIPFLGIHGQPSIKRKGTLAALMIGLVFGVALGPCTFAYLAPIIAIVFRLADTQSLLSVSLILFYALGHCTVIVLAGTFTSIVQKYLNWNDRSKGAVILKKLCGSLVVLGGIYIIFLTH